MAKYLAEAARLEGAAVFAFAALERELRQHGAPAHLVARAAAAQRDEQRHHAMMSLLARRAGAQVGAVSVQAPEVRTLLEVAMENAAEGCVRETLGAAVAVVQGECATDPRVRKAMRAIAADETEHAALGWAVHAWAGARLSRGERARVRDARMLAQAQLLTPPPDALAPELSLALGLPDAPAWARLTAALAPLWRS